MKSIDSLSLQNVLTEGRRNPVANSPQSELKDGPSHSPTENRSAQYEYLGLLGGQDAIEFQQIPLCQKRAGPFCGVIPAQRARGEALAANLPVKTFQGKQNSQDGPTGSPAPREPTTDLGAV